MRPLICILTSAAVALSVTNQIDAGLVQGGVTLQYSSAASAATGFHPSTTVPVNLSVLVATVTSAKFSADFSFATSGKFTAQHKSNISIAYPDQLVSPGTATIGFLQSGLANSFSENSPGVQIGAGSEFFIDPAVGSNFSIPIDVLDVDLFIGTAKSNSGTLGSTLSDSDTASAGRVAVGVAVPLVDVGTVGATPTVTGTSTVKVGSTINAILAYHNESMPGVTGTIAVPLSGAGNVTLDLPEPGKYDFLLSGYRLAGTRTNTTAPGVTFDATVFNNQLASKFVGIPAANRSTTRSFTYLQTSASQNLAFSIDVLSPNVSPSPVPEPSSFALFSIAGIILAGYRRRRGRQSSSRATVGKFRSFSNLESDRRRLDC